MTMGALSMAARVTGGQLVGTDVPFASVSTDTRTLESGALFFALRGPHHDGSAFVAAARAAGAAGAVVARRQPDPLPQIEVADTRRALAVLARDWRRRFALPMVAITGSNGKTTVKEMCASILREAYDPAAADDAVLMTWGNLNNAIGMPVTLLWLRERHRAAAIEMGASRAGDIALLVDIAAPGVGLVTNAGPAHLAGFGGSVRDVAVAKGEMYSGLPPSATAIINADDAFAGYWRGLCAGRTVRTFGLSGHADYRAESISVAAGPALHFRLITPAGSAPVVLPMAGRHNVMNALAAAAACAAAGVGLEAIRTGLAGMANVPGRTRPVAARQGAQVYDDTYNANPASVAAAIDFLAGLPGERWLVLGDMAELGTAEVQLHAEVGALARQRGIDRLWTVGPLARAAAEAFGDGGRGFDDIDTLTAALDAGLKEGLAVLVKGSRRMGLERVVAALAAVPAGEGH